MRAALVDPFAPDVDAPNDGRACVLAYFPRLDLAALLAADRPPRRWVLHGLIPAGAAVALVAPAGVGKSLLLLALALDVVRGRRTFAGLRIPRRRRVLYIDMENTVDDLAERLKDLGLTPDDAADLDGLILLHLPALAPLDTAGGGAELDAVLDAYGIGPDDLVILDSFQRITDGPENDSDTARAYYRHTGMMLKRRGCTVVRADNTGKDVDRGARGSSSKRDDVDLELRMTRDDGRNGHFTIEPNKARIPDVHPLHIELVTDDDGRIHYAAAADPFRAAVLDALAALDAAAVPREHGERRAADMLKASGFTVSRAHLRAAIRERRDTAISAPGTVGAPLPGAPDEHRADDERRTPAHPTDDGHESAPLQRMDRADDTRRTTGAPAPGAPRQGAPPPPPSMRAAHLAHDDESSPVFPGYCPKCGHTGRHTSWCPIGRESR